MACRVKRGICVIWLRFLCYLVVRIASLCIVLYVCGKIQMCSKTHGFFLGNRQLQYIGQYIQTFYVLAAFADHGWFWVDAHDPDGDNQFSQSRTGLALPYSSWASGEPSYINQKCAYMDAHTTNWNDVNCGTEIPFICEYNFLIWVQPSFS